MAESSAYGHGSTASRGRRRLASGRWQSFSLGVEAARREAANDDGLEHRIGLDARFRW